jgi:hypothetical protein
VRLFALGLGFALGLAGCGPSCLDAAEAAAQERVERECPGVFETCPASEAILADLQRAQEACP